MRLNQVAQAILLFVVVLLPTVRAQAQNDKVEILRLRNAYNAALKNFDENLGLSFLTNDAQTTISNGTLIHGKENLRRYIRKATGPKMYWVRTPSEIDINTELGLAWEAGIWKGYTVDSGQKSVAGGKYSAMWTKINGTWKIKSQLFVKLE